MGLAELFLVAVGLSMDAFAAAVCKGLSIGKAKARHALTVGLYFGAFQAAMPLLGYYAGTRFAGYIAGLDHWVAFLLLAFIGGRMIYESRKENCPAGSDAASLSPRAMLPLAVATSIDALAVGVSFALVQSSIGPAALFIGVTTLALSMLGVMVGRGAGERLKGKAEFAGGAVLVIIGIKILAEHTGLI
ncbi:MAG TPA: manganese efflux pump MntP family protein [Candidatus Limnocylindria bacterium]|nr:manganese efflux pump MntP family protein [Candidatus Limnocylindria bacterium]